MFKSSGSLSRLQSVGRRIQQLERHSLGRRNEGQCVPRLAALQERLHNHDILFRKKLQVLWLVNQAVEEQVERLDKQLKQQRKLCEQEFKETTESMSQYASMLDLEPVEQVINIEVGELQRGILSQPEQLQLEEYWSNLERLREDLNEQQENRNDIYSKLVSDVGEQIQELQHLIRDERESRSKNNESIKKSVVDIRSFLEQQMQQESSTRKRQQEDFARLLEETCIKLEHSLFSNKC